MDEANSQHRHIIRLEVEIVVSEALLTLPVNVSNYVNLRINLIYLQITNPLPTKSQFDRSTIIFYTPLTATSNGAGIEIPVCATHPPFMRWAGNLTDLWNKRAAR